MIDLLPADILLDVVTSDSPWSSKLVADGQLWLGEGTREKQYSHATILSNSPGWNYEAVFPWSGYHKIDYSRTFEIWRIKEITDEERQKVLRWCAKHTGEMYNLLGIVTCGYLGLPHTAVCSEWVGRAFASVGIKIPFEGHKLLSPDTIAEFDDAQMIATYYPGRGYV